MKTEEERNFNKFADHLERNQKFIVFDKLYKENPTKENYDNLVELILKKLRWLRKKNGNFFIFMIAHNGVPLYSSQMGDANTYKNHIAHKIALPSAISYYGVVYVEANGTFSNYDSSGQTFARKSGVVIGYASTSSTKA